MAVKIFLFYAHNDIFFLKHLEAHLSILKRRGFIGVLHDRDISSGENWGQEISEQMREANIILLLVSADFISSEFCDSEELKRAVERHKRGEALVIPIILRPCLWEVTSFGQLQTLPKDGKAVVLWHDLDHAYSSIAHGIYNAVVELEQQ